MRIVSRSFAAALLALGLSAAAAHADERLAGIACRSVHLQFPAPEGTLFYNEVAVEQSAPGTYFAVCGFTMGYFGIQELGDGRKVVIFSVWDPGNQNNPDAVAPEERVLVVHEGDGVRVKRFGNEGTGGQSFFDYDWKPGETYRFLVRAEPQGERTAFSGWFYLNDEKQWKHLVTFATLAQGKLLGGCYSFVEDFRRNRESAGQARRARFGNGWVRSSEGQWIALTRARFTADSNPDLHIDAGTAGGRFFLATGGETENRHSKLLEWIELSPPGVELPDGVAR